MMVLVRKRRHVRIWDFWILLRSLTLQSPDTFGKLLDVTAHPCF